MIIDGFNNDTVYNVITVPGPPGTAGPQGIPGAAYLGSVSSGSAMNALTGNTGDYCYRSDLGMFYFLMPAGAPTPWGGVTVPIPMADLDSSTQAILTASATAMRPLSTTTILTASTSPAISQTTYYNAASGNLTPTLPALSGLSVGARLAVRRDPADFSTNTVTLACAGSDTFYSSAATVATFPLTGEQRELQVISVSGTKYWAHSGAVNPVASNDDRYQPSFVPADYGWRGWSHDYAACNSSGVIPTAGTVYLTRLPLRIKQTVTNLVIGVSVAGASLTSGQNFAGLYQNGNLLASTADQTTPWQSTGFKTMALSTPQLVDPANGTVYAGFYANGTTRPTVLQAAVAGTNPFINPAFKRYVNDITNTGRTTSLQSTLGTLSASSPIWAAWS